MSYQEMEINYIEYAKEKGITLEELLEQESEEQER